ncbi:hypothetical protein BV22DRAFT_1008474 [Leucogyrophana mollusca]|uniref:Uncharacterized protein n=1 Tax=Leucogyrophana mollusca TaxID=85980 RepID=A0ACB8BPC1_9AGAM|nr:hypothetical protein BV22DRAFT_1008474 [Leucogyrophana mollusca]
MLAWTAMDAETNELLDKRSQDPGPAGDFVIIDAHATPHLVRRLCRITVTLVDWASVLEIATIVIDSESSLKDAASFPDDLRVWLALLVGDSISCGYALSTEDGGQPIPHGYLDAFPSVAQKLLRYHDPSFNMRIQTIAYPGIALVSSMKEGTDEGMSAGMVDKFFHITPWDESLCPTLTEESPSVLIIALGTNDEALGVTTDRFSAVLRDFMRRLIRIFEASLVHIVVLEPFPDFTDHAADGSPPPSPLFTECIAMTLDEMRRSHQAILFHAFRITSGIEGKHTMDGLHPTVEGHEVYGLNFAKELSSMLSVPRALGTRSG